MLVKIEARILIFPGTDFHFPSTSVPPGTFLGSAVRLFRLFRIFLTSTRLRLEAIVLFGSSTRGPVCLFTSRAGFKGGGKLGN